MNKIELSKNTILTALTQLRHQYGNELLFDIREDEKRKEWESITTSLDKLISRYEAEVYPSGREAENTKISYMYRDADNYKQWNEVVIRGLIRSDQIDTIGECLIDGEYFIPSDIDPDFPEKKFEDETDADHDYFELDVSTAFTPTTDHPTTRLTPESLVNRFISAACNEWEVISEEEAKEMREMEVAKELVYEIQVLSNMTPDLSDLTRLCIGRSVTSQNTLVHFVDLCSLREYLRWENPSVSMAPGMKEQTIVECQSVRVLIDNVLTPAFKLAGGNDENV